MIFLRKAEPVDIAGIMTIIEEAREFLRVSGSDQWQSGYPAASDVERDIELGQGYVLVVDGVLAGYAAVITGEEPAYTKITEGSWSNDSLDYVTVHRLALSDTFRGKSLSRFMFSDIFTLMKARGYKDFRIDTHAKNKIMQHIFEREGFVKRGLVWIEGERIAYQLNL